MQQLTQRASLNSRWPIAPHRRVDLTPTYDPYGWDSHPPTRLGPVRMGRLGRLALGSDDGEGPSTGQYVAAGAGAATGIATILTAPTVGGKVSGAGTVLLTAAPLLGPAAPIVAIAGAVVVAAGQIMTFLHIGDGCGQSCILTSDWANQAEHLLRNNIDAYFSSPAPRLATSRDEALRGFDAIWGQLAKACSAAQLGAAGKNCIGDREAGACHFHQTGESPWPGGPKLGDCWNWFAAYRDPIAHDTQVVDPSTLDTGAGAGGVGADFSAGLTNLLGSKNSLLWLGVGLLALGALGGD